MAKDTAERGLERAQAGQSLAELPIVLVLFLVVMFGIVDGSRLILAYNTVSLSAREGVRYAVVRGASSGRRASEADIAAFVQSKTVGVPVDVEVTWNPDSNPGSTVVVQVTNVFTPVAPFPLVPRSVNLTSRARMVISR